jgi:DNA topoisomerase IA
MVKNLVIVESPAKAKTIEGFLGKEFMVKSSFGHIRDLKKGNKGVLVEEQFEPVFEGQRTYLYLKLTMTDPVIPPTSQQPEPLPQDVVPVK